ncbi:MAG: hypothetical protein JXA13_03900 [Anaerolineales bacterium]|nr:hypothetical protein [Anaerolineales bacterium]
MPKKIVVFVSLVLLLMLPMRVVLAKGLDDGIVLVGENYTLESGETINGDVVVVGGDVVIEEGAVVNGSIVLVGGSLTLDGHVTVDMVTVFSATAMGSEAVVNGDLVTVFGAVARDSGAEVDGQVISTFPAPSVDIPVPPEAPPMPEFPLLPAFTYHENPAQKAFNILFFSVMIGGMAMLMALFLPKQTQQVARAIVRQPLVTGGLGLLIIVVAPLVVVILAVTVILIPVAVITALALPLTWLFGVIALGVEVGQRFTGMIEQRWPPVLTAGFGTFLLVLFVQGVGQLPCIGWLFQLLLGLVAIGAVTVTIFGTRPYPVPAVTPLAVPPADSDEQPAG